MKDSVYRDLKKHFPFLVEEAASFREVSPYEIVIELKDGSFFVYDDYEKTFRRLPQNVETLTEEECRDEFKYRLRKLLYRKGISQLELSERTGISYIAISNYLNGRNTPSFYNADRIARALWCSLDDLRYW